MYETSEPYHTESVWAAAEIKKRTNGKFDIEVFPASSLGKETDINQGMPLGTVDMIISGPSFAARSYPRLGIAYYPFIFRDADHLLAYSKSPVFAEMVEEFRKKTGIQMTAYTYYGARQTTSNRPFTDCAGMKGLKIRVPDVPAYMATPKSCGANPTPIAFAEVYLALQNGTVDAQENPLTTIEAKKFYEVQKAIMMTVAHRRRPDHADRAARVEQADVRREEDLHRRHAGSRRPCDRQDQEARGRAGRRVQEEGTADRHGRTARASSTRCSRTRRWSRWASRRPTTTRSSRSSTVRERERSSCERSDGRTRISWQWHGGRRAAPGVWTARHRA